ncbi:hypothetical protein SOVF_064280 [Spinacia oleracea]|nr:hypothetical protein SOVF_064280 [Spinacia oleracea]
MAIRADRRRHFMSVEFAMQREMEYRQKLDNKGSGQTQVPRPTSSQDPRATPRTNLNLHSANRPVHIPENPGSVPLTRPPLYPCPAPYSRPSPSSGPSRSTPLPVGIFTCKICQLDCKTGFNLLSHYQGQKHRAKVGGVRPAKGKEVSNSGGTMQRENEKRPYCDVCGIWCTDEYNYRLHFSCTNHILKQYDWLMKKRMRL